ncbi:MAG: hypothetical protein ABSH20_27510, partial [Tepidisphaeraceae bacterium]
MSRGKQAASLAVASGGTLLPGQIQFYEAIQPPLVSGAYQLCASQTIQLTAEQPVYTDSQAFAIAGPRFRLQPGQVQQVYPPANLSGTFNEVLPHTVFRDRTLPWSRTIDGSVPKPNTVPPPWLALLTLYPSDLLNGSAPIPIQQGTVGGFLTAKQGVIVPAIQSSSLTPEQLAEPLMYIELPQATFLGIAPTLLDLPYLAHARQVNTDGKEILGLDEDGYFSVLVGNRLPMASTGTDNVLNTAMVVSLEGLQANLPVDGTPTPVTPGTVVRMAVLSSWTFTCTPATADFAAIMQHLNVDLMALPSPPLGAQPTPAQTVAAEALGWGYVPLENNTRSGEQTTSWYRSPCVPIGSSLDPNGPYEYSDQAVRYDSGPAVGQPGTGLFDLSYAAAWQIGRLIALSDGTFAKALMDWRRTLAQSQNQQQGHADFLERLPGGKAHAMALGAPTPGDEHAHGRLAINAVLKKIGGTASAALPKKLRHEERGRASLPGVLSAA